MRKIVNPAILVLGIAALFSCCTSDDTNENFQEANASLSIKLSNPNLRSSGNTPRLTESLHKSTNHESKCSNLTVFVFSYSTGALEKREDFITSGENIYKIDGLSTTGLKRIVVFVNVPKSLDTGIITSYRDLSKFVLTLDSQNNIEELNAIGLFMSGETSAPVSLSASSTTEVRIGIKRRVAKVILSSLIINPESTADINLFKLEGVSIQKARLMSKTIGATELPAEFNTANYAGGISSPHGAIPYFSATREYLRENISNDFDTHNTGTNIISQNDELYFYLLPNNNTKEAASVFCIYGTYNDVPVYFPFIINSDEKNGTINSNMKYKLFITLKKIHVAGENPNDIPEEALLELSLIPENWEGPIEQHLEW